MLKNLADRKSGRMSFFNLQFLICNLQLKRWSIANCKLGIANCKLNARHIRNYALSVACLLGLASLAWACNVPVFRFALERWRPDPYRVVLLHQGPLTPADLETLRPLEEQHDKALANFALRTVDVDQIDKETEAGGADAALVASLGEVKLPMLVVHYPASLNIPKPVWTGAPTRESIAGLTDSAVRQELVRRLAEGQTAVWIVLECGQKDRDDAAAALVEAEIKRLEQELKLPELTTAPQDAILADTPLKIAFSTIRLRRDDPAEAPLAAMLIGSEPDLAERTGDPLVFPVFGRGRALWPLVGAGVTAKNIQDSAGFLVGACSCEVKELNPGFDLLLTADWDELLTSSGVPLSAVETKTSAIPEKAELVPIPAGAPPTAATTPTTVTTPAPVVVEYSVAPVSFPVAWLAIGGGLLVVSLVVVVVLVVAAQGRGRDSQA
jgi:hypothetical protein